MKNLGQKGFTLIELLVVMGLFTILTALATVNFSTPQAQASLSAISAQVVGDLRAAQVNAMEGESNGQATVQPQGIHFENRSYTIFHGNSYAASETSNFVISLDSNLSFSNITLPVGNVVFIPLSGELTGYNQAANSVTLVDTNTGQQKVITINRYGVVSN